MSHSSAEVTYRPEGPGHRARTAGVDLTRIPDPEAWLTNRLGPLARFEIRLSKGTAPDTVNLDAEGLDAFATCLQTALATRATAHDAFSARLGAARPPGLARPSSPTTQPEDIHP